MSRKDMIIEYCLMYVDINGYGQIPDMKKLQEYSEEEMKQLYLTMLKRHNKLMENT